jgi:tetratricopeptide (TPR) repeat protein
VRLGIVLFCLVLVLATSCISVYASDENKDAALTWLNKGIDLLNGESYKEAINAFDKVIELNPEKKLASLAWEYKGDSFQSLGKYDDAIKAYNKAIELTPYSGSAWDSKAGALQHLGKNAEAALAHETAIEVDPNYWNATKRLWGSTETIPVHIKMGPYDVSYNDSDPPIEWTTDSYKLYTISSVWENDELKTIRTPSGMVYHACSENGTKEIWITHLTDKHVDYPTVVIGKHLSDNGYQDSYEESIMNADTYADEYGHPTPIDGHTAYEQTACKKGTLKCINLVAWTIDDQTTCEVSAGLHDYVLETIHISA